jgi:zinc protease
LANPSTSLKAKDALLEEVRLLIEKGVPQAELDEMKKGWKNGFETTLANDDWVVGKLVQGLYVGRTLLWEEELNAKVKALTPDDLQRVLAAGIIKPEAFAVVVAADQKKAQEGLAAPPE